MSSQNSSLDDFVGLTPGSDEADTPDQQDVEPRTVRRDLTPAVSERPTAAQRRAKKWTPHATRANSCNGCGAHVSREFARTASDDHGTVHACPSCTTATELRNGAAAGIEYDRVDHNQGPLRGGML